MGEKGDISDYDLQALVDGAFDENVARRLREVVEQNRDLRLRLRELEAQKEQLRAWWEEFKQEH